MRLSTKGARLIERKSDERDTFLAVNSVRDVANQRGRYARDTTTTDATATEIWRDTVNADSALTLRVSVVASGGGNFAAYDRRVVVTRTGSAAAVIQATDAIGTDVETDPTWGIAFSVSTGDIVLSVTGAVGATIDWRVDVGAVWIPFE